MLVSAGMDSPSLDDGHCRCPTGLASSGICQRCSRPVAVDRLHPPRTIIAKSQTTDAVFSFSILVDGSLSIVMRGERLMLTPEQLDYLGRASARARGLGSRGDGA